MATIYFLTNKQSEAFIKRQNKDGHYVESVKRYLDPKSLKEATGLETLTGIKDVWVDDDPATRSFPHHLIAYNEAYTRQWGIQPLYGNVFVIVSDKVWNSLPAEKRKTDDEVKTLSLQPTHPDQKWCEKCGMPNGANPPTPLCDVCEEEDAI